MRHVPMLQHWIVRKTSMKRGTAADAAAAAVLLVPCSWACATCYEQQGNGGLRCWPPALFQFHCRRVPQEDAAWEMRTDPSRRKTLRPRASFLVLHYCCPGSVSSIQLVAFAGLSGRRWAPNFTFAAPEQQCLAVQCENPPAARTYTYSS